MFASPYLSKNFSTSCSIASGICSVSMILKNIFLWSILAKVGFSEEEDQFLLVFKSYAESELTVIDLKDASKTCMSRSVSPFGYEFSIHGTFAGKFSFLVFILYFFFHKNN